MADIFDRVATQGSGGDVFDLAAAQGPQRDVFDLVAGQGQSGGPPVWEMIPPGEPETMGPHTTGDLFGGGGGDAWYGPEIKKPPSMADQMQARFRQGLSYDPEAKLPEWVANIGPDVLGNVLWPLWGTAKDFSRSLGATFADPFLQAAGQEPYYQNEMFRDPGPLVGLSKILTDWDAAKAAGGQIWHEVTHPAETFTKRPVSAPLDLLGLGWGGAALARKTGQVGSRAMRAGVARKLDTHAALKDLMGTKAGWLAGLDVRSQARNVLGTKAERLGGDVYGSHMYHDAKGNVINRAIAAETGERSLTPGMQKAMRWMSPLSPSRGLIAGQTIRDTTWLAGPWGQSLARKMGITPDEMVTAARIAETIPHEAVGPGGHLRFGVKVADAEGTPVYRHGLDPRQAQEQFTALRPEVQRFVLEFVEPAEGYQGPVRLRDLGLNESMARFVDEAMDPKAGGENKTLTYRTVDAAEAQTVQAQTGIAGTEGFRHVLDNQTVRHALQSHGDPVREAAQGQIPLTKTDILRIPEIISEFDVLNLSKPHGKKPATIIYSKRFNGTVYFVEEVRNRVGDLAFKSMWIKRGSAAANTPHGGNRVGPDLYVQKRRAPNLNIANTGTDGNSLDGVLPTPERPKGQMPTTFSRNKAHEEAVAAGILEPGQRVEGYVTHAGPDPSNPPLLGDNAPLMDLYPKLNQPFSRKRTSKEGTHRRLDEAVTWYRQALHGTQNKIELIREQTPRIIRPVPINPETGNYEKLRPDQMFNIRKAHNPSTGLDEIIKIPQIEIEIPAKEAKTLGLQPGKHLIDKPAAEDFKLILGWMREGKTDTWLTGLLQLIKDESRYWSRNVLSHFGTIATNWIGGLTQYSGKVIEDVLRGDLRQVGNDLAAPLQALRPRNIRDVPSEVLGSNVANQFGNDMGRFGRRVSDRLKAGEAVSLPDRVMGRLNQVVDGLFKVTMGPFGAVDNFWKRAIYLSEMKTWAQREAGAMAKVGTIGKSEVAPTVERLVAGAFTEHPELYKRVMLGPVDRFGYDYANIPNGLDKWRKHPLGTALAPFMVYPYKYARMLGSQARAFNPLLGMPARERLARAGGLAATAGGPYFILKALFGDSEVERLQEEYREQFPDAPALGTNLAGRTYVGSHEPGKETFLRTAKYGYLNLPGAFTRGFDGFFDFLDEFKSKGPLLPILAMALGMEPKRGRRDFSSVAGKIAAGQIPFFRIWADMAKQTDTDPATGRIRHRRPVGFMEQIQNVFPGMRESLRQPVDAYTGKPVTLDPTEELFKFFTGINLRTLDVAREKQAISKAVLRWSDRYLKEDQLVDLFSRRHPGVDRETIRANLPRIRMAGHDYLRSQFKQMSHKAFKAMVERGADIFDPIKMRDARKVMRLFGNYKVRNLSGWSSVAVGGFVLRVEAGSRWIKEHLEK